MATYHTEGIVKSIELDGGELKFKIEPTAPYKITEKKGGNEFTRILFIEGVSVATNTIAVVSETKTNDSDKSYLVIQCYETCLDNPTKAILCGNGTMFKLGDDVSDHVNFAALLALKQNRTRIQVSISYDAGELKSPAEITDMKICE